MKLDSTDSMYCICLLTEACEQKYSLIFKIMIISLITDQSKPHVVVAVPLKFVPFCTFFVVSCGYLKPLSAGGTINFVCYSLE